MHSNAQKKTENNQVQFKSTIHGSDIVWLHMPQKGRGVFAGRAIAKDEIIEISPVIPMSKDLVPDDTTLDHYAFRWKPEVPGEECCLPLGYCMMYNHSDKPNMNMSLDFEDKSVTMTANRDILEGEELTWDYDCQIWFEVK